MTRQASMSISPRRTLILLVLALSYLVIAHPQPVLGASSASGKSGGLRGYMEQLIEKGKNQFSGGSTTSPTTTESPTSLTFTGVQGGSNPPFQTIGVTNSGGGTLSWTASAPATWLSVSPGSGSTKSGQTTFITVSANTAGLSASTYSATVTIYATGSTNPTVQVPVTLNVATSPPTITQNPPSLTFAAVQGGSQPPSQKIGIQNTGSGSLSWALSSSAQWLTLTPTSGTTATGTSTITARVNTSGLTTNLYTATITITASGASNTPQTIPLTLAVIAPAAGSALLRWSASSTPEVVGYKVYAGTASGSYGQPVDVGNVTTFQVINLQSGTTYYFVVTAYDVSGLQSVYSNEANKSIP